MHYKNSISKRGVYILPFFHVTSQKASEIINSKSITLLQTAVFVCHCIYMLKMVLWVYGIPTASAYDVNSGHNTALLVRKMLCESN
jgi:hypothetical protein